LSGRPHRLHPEEPGAETPGESGSVTTDQVQLNVPGISPELNDAVRAEMEACECNRNEIIVAILAKEFRVRYKPNSRWTTTAAANPPSWHLKMPARLRKRIKQRAVAEDKSARDLVVELLSAHFGVPFVPVFHTARRRKSWKREQAA
jgi:hypothetical protein